MMESSEDWLGRRGVAEDVAADAETDTPAEGTGGEGMVFSSDGQNAIAEYLYEAIGAAVEALDKTVFGDDFSGKTLAEILSRDGVDNDRDAIVLELLGHSTTINSKLFLQVMEGYGYEWAITECKLVRDEMRRAGDVAVEMVSGPADLYSEFGLEGASADVPEETAEAPNVPLTEAVTFEEAGYHPIVADDSGVPGWEPMTDEDLAAQLVPVPVAEVVAETVAVTVETAVATEARP